MLCIAKKPRRNRTQLKDYVVLYVYIANSREKRLWIIVAEAQESLNLLLVLISLPMSLKPYYCFCEGGFHPVPHQWHVSVAWDRTRYSNPLILVYISLTINSIFALDACCSYEDSIASFALVHPWQLPRTSLKLQTLYWICLTWLWCTTNQQLYLQSYSCWLVFYFSGSIPNSDIG